MYSGHTKTESRWEKEANRNSGSFLEEYDSSGDSQVECEGDCGQEGGQS